MREVEELVQEAEHLLRDASPEIVRIDLVPFPDEPMT